MMDSLNFEQIYLLCKLLYFYEHLQLLKYVSYTLPVKHGSLFPSAVLSHHFLPCHCRYEVGEKYDRHNDYIAHHVQRNPGPRMLTVYFYLNDVPAGGGTRFPDLNLTVTPKQGRVVMWPSVLDGNVTVQDLRTDHEALPVEQGVKYGMNSWIHIRDFKTPNAKACVK